MRSRKASPPIPRNKLIPDELYLVGFRLRGSTYRRVLDTYEAARPSASDSVYHVADHFRHIMDLGVSVLEENQKKKHEPRTR